MARENLLLVAIAVVLAVVAGGAAYLAVHTARQAALSTQEELPVLVASRSIPAGTVFDSTNVGVLLRAERRPPSQVAPGAVPFVSLLLGRATVREIRAGEVVRLDDLGQPPSAGGVPLIDADRVGMPLAITESVLVPGRLERGDRVTVIASLPQRQPDGSQSVSTEVVAREVLVVDVASGGQGARSPATLTLALRLEEGLRLHYLVHSGARLVLALEPRREQARAG